MQNSGCHGNQNEIFKNRLVKNYWADFKITGPRNAVSYVSGNRCESDCRSRDREFLPGPIIFVEIDHEIISTAILLPSPESFKKDRCQLQAKVCARSTG